MRAFLFIVIFIINFLLSQQAFAIEDVVLNIDDIEKEELNEVESRNLTLYEKIQNIRTREIYDTSQTSYLFEEILTKKSDKGVLESVELFGHFRNDFTMDIPEEGSSDLKFNVNVLQGGVRGKFRNTNTSFETSFRFNGQHKYNFFQYLPANFYISNTSIPHHTIMVGNMRTPMGVEGGTTPLLIPFYVHSQIGRNFGNVRKIGVRVKGSYDLIDYDLGGYDSGTYFRKFFPGAEFTGHVILKPLGKTDGKYGDLKIGGGISGGHNKFDYFVSTAYARYDYKKAFVDFEWAAANGYNGNSELSNKHAEGFYTTLGYNITPKLQAVARYDEFRPDKNFSNIKQREYSAGLNWFIKGQALKMILNYVFCQNDGLKDSHRIVIGTQILL